MSGFKCSCFCPCLGQETLMWRSLRGGEETVLNNFSDNTVLTVGHFSFSFPFYFPRLDIETFFFSRPHFLLHPLPLLDPGSEHQVFYCRYLWPVCLYTICVCVHVLGAGVALSSIQNVLTSGCLKSWQTGSFCFSQRISITNEKTLVSISSKR